MSREIRRVGYDAFLIDVQCPEEAAAVAEALRCSAGRLLQDVVPAMRTVMAVAWRGQADALLRRIRDLEADLPPARTEQLGVIDIPVTYNGPDLMSVARHIGATESAVIAQHTSVTWRVAFLGFAPGFGYMVSEEWTARIPRLASPRSSVSEGAVALADEFTAIYPRQSPGGWLLIGSTPFRLWDPLCTSPSTLETGRAVRFLRVGE